MARTRTVPLVHIAARVLFRSLSSRPPSSYVLIRVLMQDQNDVFFRPIIGLGDQARDGLSQSSLSPDGQRRTFNDNRGHNHSLLLRVLVLLVLLDKSPRFSVVPAPDCELLRGMEG